MPDMITQFWWMSLYRAAIVAILCAAVGYPIAKVLQQWRHGWAARLMWAIVLLPLLVPTLMVGYAYLNWSLSMVLQPRVQEAAYVALLAGKLLPVAVLVWYFAPPPPVDDAARHIAKWSNLHWRPGFVLRGRWRSGVTAASIVFLLAYTDRELATVLEVQSWTRKLFEQASFRTPLVDIARDFAPAIITQVVVVALAIAMLIWTHRRVRNERLAPRDGSPVQVVAGRAFALTVVGTACAFLCLYPLWFVTWDAVGLFHDWITSQTLARELPTFAERCGQSLFAGLYFALPATVLTYAAAWVVHRTMVPLMIAAAVPGAFGALLVALVMQNAFQWPPINGVYDNRWLPVPLVVALVLLLLPVAILLMGLLGARSQSEAVHAARMLGHEGRRKQWSRSLLWRLHDRPRVWLGLLLFVLAWFEYSATTILYPTGREPLTVIAYNNMHFGQTGQLSARVLVNFIAPVMIVALAVVVARTALRALPRRVN